MRFGAAGEGEREGGMSQRLCNALPPRPPPQARAKPSIQCSIGKRNPVEATAVVMTEGVVPLLKA